MKLEAFMARVVPEPNSGCWLWMGNIADQRGYGLVSIPIGSNRYQRIGAHRYSWILHRGPLPDGMNVCHRCDVPSCVNPEHLFLGTCADNNRDAWQKGRAFNPGPMHRGKTHCPQGHCYAGQNLILYQGRRYCRACMGAHTRIWSQRKRKEI